MLMTHKREENEAMWKKITLEMDTLSVNKLPLDEEYRLLGARSLVAE